MKLEIEKAAEGYVIRLTQPQMVQLGWAPGDFMDAELSGHGIVTLCKDAGHSNAMRIARDAMVEYRTTLEALAKS